MRQDTCLPHFLYTALWAVLATLSRCQDDILGCGGFVRPVSTPDGAKKPDLSGVKAKLYTRTGLLKGETECAPNGYYYIPIYDRGTYIIKVEGPPGWIFEPLEQEVSTAEDGICTQGKDVDFSIVGFALSGRVCSEGFNVGPQGVKLELEGPNNKRYYTETGAGGVFSFKDAPPGSYRLTASHSSWKFRTPSVEAAMAFGQAEVRDIFGVLGYELTGMAVWDDDQGLSGLDILLRPAVPAPRPAHLHCQPPGEEEQEEGWWCAAHTDSAGRYAFAHVPPGDYVVAASPAAAWADRLELEVGEVLARVGHGSSRVEAPLKAGGYAGLIRVEDAVGRGLGGVEVSFRPAGGGGEWEAAGESQQDGGVWLRGVRSAAYEIQARREHVRFSVASHRFAPPAHGPAPAAPAASVAPPPPRGSAPTSATV